MRKGPEILSMRRLTSCDSDIGKEGDKRIDSSADLLTVLVTKESNVFEQQRNGIAALT